MIPSYFHTESGTKSAGDWHLITCNGRDDQMFLRVKVEKKFRHYILRSREWINVLLLHQSVKILHLDS